MLQVVNIIYIYSYWNLNNNNWCLLGEFFKLKNVSTRVDTRIEFKFWTCE